jgi:hypothetical protein
MGIYNVMIMDDLASPNFGLIIGDTTPYGGAVGSLFATGADVKLISNGDSIVSAADLNELISDDGVSQVFLRISATTPSANLTVDTGVYHFGYYADGTTEISNIFSLKHGNTWDTSAVTTTPTSLNGHILIDDTDEFSLRNGWFSDTTVSKLVWGADTSYDNGTEIVLDTNGTTVSSLAGNGDAYVTVDNNGLLGYAASPSSYKVYTALLTQSDTNAPIPTILENTLSGTPVWSYTDAGEYVITLTGEFTPGKTFITITVTSVGLIYFPIIVPIDVDTIRLVTYDDNMTFANDLLYATSFEIRVYP